jgi:hypothetical protein
MIGIYELKYANFSWGQITIDLINNWNLVVQLLLPIFEISMRARVLFIFPKITEFAPFFPKDILEAALSRRHAFIKKRFINSNMIYSMDEQFVAIIDIVVHAENDTSSASDFPKKYLPYSSWQIMPSNINDIFHVNLQIEKIWSDYICNPEIYEWDFINESAAKRAFPEIYGRLMDKYNGEVQ